MSEIINKVVPIDAISPHEENYNQHPETQLVQLGASYDDLDQFQSVVIWQRPGNKYTQVAGHGVVEAMQRKGALYVRADILPEDTDPLKVKRIMMASNLHAKNSIPDDTMLAQLLQEQQDAGFDLASLGTDDETLRQMLEALGDAYLGEQEDGAGGDEFDTTPEEGPTRSQLGDIWICGRHKIMCADSLEKNNIDKLLDGISIDILHADPPYGINLLSKRGALGKSQDYNPVIGDDKPFDPLPFLALAPISIFWGANHFADKLPVSSFWLVWDKQGGAKDTTFATCELAWCSEHQPARVLTHVWDGFRRDSERGEQRSHPNQKPVAVIEWVLEWVDGDVVLEPFLGSGSSLIACHRMNKTCIGVEIDPRYVDVCLRRYEAETGHTAQLLERIEEPAHV